MSITPLISQFNLQLHFGGGETYTRFLSESLTKLNYRTEIVVNDEAEFWDELMHKSPHISVVKYKDWLKTPPTAENSRPIFISHGPLPSDALSIAKKINAFTVAIAHMPPQGRRPGAFNGHDLVCGVSNWVVTGLLQEPINTWPTPLYGVADISERASHSVGVYKRSKYAWDQRKIRDRLLSYLEPLFKAFAKKEHFDRRPGVTLGIVSSITPIKQFPTLFKFIAPILAEYPSINIEIFGSGGYASIRDLEKAIAPIRDRVRFWGRQTDISSVYSNIDYLLAGLPEKEALGLNIIEAQFCNVPVLAVDAAPFKETVLPNKTGFLYQDPRLDNGLGFKQIIANILLTKRELQPIAEKEHLSQFSKEAFETRIKQLLDYCLTEIATRQQPLEFDSMVMLRDIDLSSKTHSHLVRKDDIDNA